MDAIKAVQALRDGDYEALVLALDTDHLMVFTPVEGVTFTVAAFGKSHVKVYRQPDSLQLSVHSHEPDASQCHGQTVEMTQMERSLALAQGAPVGELWVDGVLTPAPELAMPPLFAMIQQLTGLTPSLVTVPDDPGALFA